MVWERVIRGWCTDIACKPHWCCTNAAPTFAHRTQDGYMLNIRGMHAVHMLHIDCASATNMQSGFLPHPCCTYVAHSWDVWSHVCAYAACLLREDRTWPSNVIWNHIRNMNARYMCRACMLPPVPEETRTRRPQSLQPVCRSSISSTSALLVNSVDAACSAKRNDDRRP